MSNENYKPKKFAELINVSVKTLQRWDREGILKAHWFECFLAKFDVKVIIAKK